MPGLRRIGAGLFTADDLARSQADWVDPLGVDLWGHRVWTVPPNSQGYLSLAAARIAELVGLGRDLDHRPDTAEWAHLLVEAARLAGHDRLAVLHEDADGRRAPVRRPTGATGRALRPPRAQLPRRAVRGGRHHLPVHRRRRGPGGVADPVERPRVGACTSPCPRSGSSSTTAARASPSNPGTRPSTGPGRRPPHTLAPALAQRGDGTLRAVLGTMGGDTQPQVVLQLLARLLVADQDPARCIGAPRWRLGDGGFDSWEGDGPALVGVEQGAPEEWVSGLRSRGHDVSVQDPWNSGYGHAHLIERTGDGTLGRSRRPPRAHGRDGHLVGAFRSRGQIRRRWGR